MTQSAPVGSRPTWGASQLPKVFDGIDHCLAAPVAGSTAYNPDAWLQPAYAYQISPRA